MESTGNENKSLQYIDKFCYQGEITGAGGGSEASLVAELGVDE